VSPRGHPGLSHSTTTGYAPTRRRAAERIISSMELGLDSLSGLREDLREAILRAAAALKAAGAREVYLFGSAAQGKLREGSDIDLAVVGLPARVFFKAMADAHTALGRRNLDLVDLEDDTPFTRYLREEGELARVA